MHHVLSNCWDACTLQKLKVDFTDSMCNVEEHFSFRCVFVVLCSSGWLGRVSCYFNTQFRFRFIYLCGAGQLEGSEPWWGFLYCSLWPFVHCVFFSFLIWSLCTRTEWDSYSFDSPEMELMLLTLPYNLNRWLLLVHSYCSYLSHLLQLECELWQFTWD